MALAHAGFMAGYFRDYDAITRPLHGAIDAQDKQDGSSVTIADQRASA
ncbi:MAG: hypothetical protein JNL71_02440, partial [Rhodospirillales bacterium]|nr:hypothetical protein [Rhodospirillales bacterium]